MGLGCPWLDPVCATSDIKLIMICNIVNDTEHLFGDIQVLFLVWILFSLLAMASSASAASAGSSMILKYISQVRAELRRQRPRGTRSVVKAEMDTMQLGSSHEGKPSVRDVCKHLNMAVSQKKGKLNRKTLVEEPGPLPSSGRSMLFLRHVFTWLLTMDVVEALVEICIVSVVCADFPLCDGGIDEPTEGRWTKYLREMIAEAFASGTSRTASRYLGR